MCCYSSWECRNTAVWVFNRDLKFRVEIASRETIRFFLTLRQLIISKIQWYWHQIHDVIVIWNFQTGQETTACGARVSFRRPLLTTNPLFASTLPWTDWVGAPNLTLSPGAGNPRCATGVASASHQGYFDWSAKPTRLATHKHVKTFLPPIGRVVFD